VPHCEPEQLTVTSDHPTSQSQRPLVVAESALIKIDPLLELLAGYLKLNPGRTLETFKWLWRGKAYARARLLERLPQYRETIPLESDLLQLAERQAASGRQVYLLADLGVLGGKDIKAPWPWVTGMISWRPELDGQHPETDVNTFPDGLEHVGNSAQHSARPSQLWALVESVRLHQWIKNVLVFAPLILGGRLDNAHALLATVLSFIALGLVASATYLLNDILDVADDRRHWSKRNRPIARGDLSAPIAATWAGIALGSGLALGALVSRYALAVLLIYAALSLAYSVALKRLPLVDGLALATQFTLRLALGVAAAQVPPSPWLFVFSMFLFTSLSLAKRHTELCRLDTTVEKSIAGRGYRAEDAPLVLAIGAASGLCAVVIITLYIIEDAFRQSFYGSTMWLWGFPPLVFLLISRIWLVTARGEMTDDPVRFMQADRAAQVLLAALTVCFLLALLAQ
jgi:4-hydroxybenzoate polyprenyltransferase